MSIAINSNQSYNSLSIVVMLSLSAVLLVVAGVVVAGAVLHSVSPYHKVSETTGRRRLRRRELLGEHLESAEFVRLIVLLLSIDLFCTVVCALEIGNEEVVELAERTSLFCLAAFLLEQTLHLEAFGPRRFFSNPWYVADAIAVSVTMAVELRKDDEEEGVPSSLDQQRWSSWTLVKIVRVWKVAIFLFDVALMRHESSELREKEHVE